MQLIYVYMYTYIHIYTHIIYTHTQTHTHIYIQCIYMPNSASKVKRIAFSKSVNFHRLAAIIHWAFETSSSFRVKLSTMAKV